MKMCFAKNIHIKCLNETQNYIGLPITNCSIQYHYIQNHSSGFIIIRRFDQSAINL